MAKIGEVLKRDLKRQRTAQLESDSDDTCCDLFDEPKKRKPLTSLQMLTVQTPTVQRPWPSTTRPYKLCIKEKIQTTRMSLMSWIWNL
ncbi:unnamed protein product [Boreogadus saida]